MSQLHADRNLLFGMLALQMDFITRDQLVAAMQAWVFDKTKPLGQIMIEQKVLEADTDALLEALVKKHLAQHGGDVHKSLGAVTSIMSVNDDLKKIVDADVQSSLCHIGVSRQEPADPYATRVTGADASAGAASVRPASAGEPSSATLRFRIIRPHARGGLGEVHVARDAELNREVALKQIQARHADDRESQARFLLEAEITGGLEHPGIVPVYGLGQYPDGRPFYAMRFIRGDSLKEALEQFHKADVPGRDPGERSLELRGLLGRFVDVCNAIGYAHSRGVLHRDLKPGNVMLGKYGETLVVDWGLAKPLDGPSPTGTVGPGEGTLSPSSASLASNTLMGSAMGTPQFMSPEQAAGQLDLLGPASDVYSLGATLYAILTGLPPVQDTDVRVVLKKVEHGEIQPPNKVKDKVPKPLDAICMKAMALAIADRYATPGALADDIEHWLADEPVSAWREPWRVRARRWLNRHRTLVTTAAAVVLVATVSLAVASVLLAAANERERAAHAEAAHNYDLARRAVEGYVDTVHKDELLHAPGMEPLRKSLLEDAAKFYKQFARENDKKPGVKAGLGRALYYLAQITGDIGDEREAIKLHLRAREVLTPLAAVPPDPVAQTDLARCWHHLGRLYRLTYQLDKSEAAYGEALKIWKKLAQEEPARDLYRAELARSQLGLGNVYQVDRRTKKAGDIYADARDTRQKLVDDHPKDSDYKRDLAVSLSNLATVFMALGQKEEAKSAYAKAIDIQKALVAGDERISQYQNDEARSYYSLAALELDAGEGADAEAHFKRAEDIWTGLKKTHPAVFDFQAKLAEALSGRAKVYSLGKGKMKEAEELCKEAIAIQQKLADDHKDVPSYRGNLAWGFTYLGDVYRAANDGRPAVDAYVKAADLLETLTKGPGAILQFEGDLARTLNGLGLLYTNLDEKKKAKEAYDQAMSLWKKLVSARPQDLDFSVNLSATAYNLGRLERSNRNPHDAIEWYTRAIDAFKEVGPARRKDADIRKALYQGYWRRAETLGEAGRNRDALNDWNEALESAGELSPPQRLQRTVALARAGEHAEALTEAEALEPEAVKKNSGTAFYELGRVFAICSAGAGRDVKLAANQRQPTAEKYAEHAVGLLQRARTAKYFQLPANRARLRNDSDFDPIRQQADYAKLFE